MCKQEVTQAGKNHIVELYVGDFKKSGDYEGITENYAVFDGVAELIERYYKEFEQTPENCPTIKILLIDEYAGYIVWLTQRNKKKSEEIKGAISNILMTGRSRHCFAWCVQQRMSASLFPAGIGEVDNFQICTGLGRLTVESRKSLFAGEHLEDKDFGENYHPKTGQGLILIDGQELQPILAHVVCRPMSLCVNMSDCEQAPIGPITQILTWLVSSLNLIL